MNRIARVAWVFSLIFLLAGCATPASRRDELSKAYPQWDTETLRLVSIGVVQVGMTKEQASEALKVPQVYYLTVQDNKWSYVDNIIPDRDSPQMEGKILYFKDDRIVEIRHFAYFPEQLIHLEW